MRRIGAFLLGATVTAAGSLALDKAGIARKARWQRTNYRQATVSLTGGLSVAAASLVVGGCTPQSGHERAGLIVAVGAAAGFGVIDDQATDPAAARGLTGHLDALRHGQVTTGMMKLAGIPAAALIAAALSSSSRRNCAGADIVIDGALVAGSANLVNLFDLRPGRALKVALAASALLSCQRGSAGRLAASAAGISAAGLKTDLGETTMLGDGGANAIGALIGLAAARLPQRGARITIAASLVAAILASEKVSFSRIIERSRPLHAIDSWGRIQ